MLSIKTKEFSIAAILIFVGVFPIDAAAQATIQNTNNPPTLFSTKSLEGAWKLNIAESDDVLTKVRDAFQPEKQNVTSQKATTLTPAELAEVITSVAAPNAVIIVPAQKEVTINENFKTVVFTRTVSSEGKTKTYQMNSGARYFVSGSYKNNKLSIRTVSPWDGKLVETYELAEDGMKLKVTVMIEDERGKPVISLRRVYDRSLLELFSGEPVDMN